MSSYQLEFLSAAIAEVETTIDWYRERSERAAFRFFHELEATAERIVAGPQQFALYEFHTRRALMRHFPYWVVFRESGSVIEIIAVAHASRRPTYWKARG